MKITKDERDGVETRPWIRTANGGRFYFLEYDGSQYDMDVVAASLSRVCRYGGHIRDEFEDDIYSVAQHSVYVYRLLRKKNAPVDTFPWAIGHDAPEAFYGDVTSPLKGLLPEYEKMENASALSYRAQYGIPYNEEIHEYVKWADYQLYFAERRVLTEIPKGEEELAPAPEYTLQEIDPQFHLWRPKYARFQYKMAFLEAMSLYQGSKYATA